MEKRLIEKFQIKQSYIKENIVDDLIIQYDNNISDLVVLVNELLINLNNTYIGGPAEISKINLINYLNDNFNIQQINPIDVGLGIDEEAYIPPPSKKG